MKDMSNLINNIENQIQEFSGSKERVAMAVIFVDPIAEGNNVHWITNVSRPDGIKLLENTVLSMKRNFHEQS